MLDPSARWILAACPWVLLLIGDYPFSMTLLETATVYGIAAVANGILYAIVGLTIRFVRDLYKENRDLSTSIAEPAESAGGLARPVSEK